MGLSETDVQKQIRHMIAFIDQEAIEKCEEIDAKAEEEFNIEKGRLVQTQRAKIIEFYNKKMKNIELQKKIQNSNLMNQARLQILQAREQQIKDVLEEARSRLSRVATDESRYREMLEGLILQSLYQLLEEKVNIQCRQQDIGLVEAVLPAVRQKYTEATKKNVEIVVDRNDCLGADVSGGVVVTARFGKIRVVNTLDSRLEQMSYQLVPELRTMLFGSNPNRRFKD